MADRGDVAARVDANAAIGVGHLRRCVTLLRQLRGDDFNIRLVCQQSFGKELAPLIHGIPISWIADEVNDEARDAAATLSIIGRHPTGSSWVIIDHYGLGAQWEKIIREAGHGVLAIDDFRNRDHFADILVSDASAPFNPVLNGGLVGARQLLGATFAIVDPEFAFSEEISASRGRKRLLVSYGGSDPTGETGKALEAVRLLRHDNRSRDWLGRVDVVVGPVSTRTDDVICLARGIEDLIIHLAPKSLAPLIRNTDLFLTAGGNSMIEALTMRKPCVVTITSDNQAIMVAQLLEKRAIVSLGDHATVSPVDVAQAVTSALADHDQLSRKLSNQVLFDHHGARRISEAMQSMSEEKSREKATFDVRGKRPGTSLD